MKKFVLTALTFACLFALSTGLRADDGSIVAQVDRDFVVAGKTLPAGTYRFAPDSPGSRFVTIRNIDGDSTTFALSMIFDGAAVEHAHLLFQEVNGVSYLSEVGTPLGVFTLAAPRALTQNASTKQLDAMSSSGTN
jgi:hypothetical protein